MGTFVSRRHLDLVSRLAIACAEAGHLDCKNAEECGSMLQDLEAVKEQIEASAHYDIFVPYQQRQRNEPNASWPTAALVRCITTLMGQPPWGEDAFRRSVWLTSAMARLGAIGLPADAILRTCAAPALKRRLIFHIATAWHGRWGLGDDMTNIPDVLHPWLEKLESLTGLSMSGERIPPLEEVLVKAATGPFSCLIDDWIGNTAVSHVIAWRLDDALRVEVLPTDLVLSGGLTATRWVFDRFSQTYLDDWDEDSLVWELCYAQSPQLTAEQVGIPRRVLEERPTAAVLAVDAIARRHTRGREILSSTDFAGVDVGEIQDQIVFLANAGDIRQAQGLARAATQKAPHQQQLRDAYAFSLIPSDPATARSHFEQNDESSILSDLNIAACYLVEGERERLAGMVSALKIVNQVNQPVLRAWLWTPSYLSGRSQTSVMRYYEASEWLAEVAATI